VRQAEAGAEGWARHCGKAAGGLGDKRGSERAGREAREVCCCNVASSRKLNAKEWRASSAARLRVRVERFKAFNRGWRGCGLLFEFEALRGSGCSPQLGGGGADVNENRTAQKKQPYMLSQHS
jgi:hypothetical protein